MKPKVKSDFDIIIVGAGMVGLTIASLLKDDQLRIAVVDKSDTPPVPMVSELESSNFDARVSALSAASREILKRAGAWRIIESKRYCDFSSMFVWDADGTGSVKFSAEELSVPRLGTIIENSFVVDALLENLYKKANLEIFRPCSIISLDEGDESVLLETEDNIRLRAKLVIAADGVNSKIRELANFRVREWEYNHDAIVATVKTESPHQEMALQRFMQTGPLAFLPLCTGLEIDCQDWSSIVWSAEPSYAKKLFSLSDDEFCFELTQASESRLGRIIDCSRRHLFPLRQRHAVNYSKRRIALAGDAAHSIHPLAGQGANLGLLDAEALVNKITEGLNAGREVADPVIMDRYQRARKAHNLGMMGLMQGFKHLFADETMIVRWLRNVGMSSINNMSMVKNYLARQAMGLDS